MNEKHIENLRESIGANRFNHTMGVVKTALELAKVYNYSEDKTYLAAILHDCAKFKDKSKILKMSRDFDIILDEVTSLNFELVHASLGAKIAEQLYDITDLEILNAIRYHTTGKANMNILEKIIYISDYIEPNRNYPGIEEIRDLAYKDLDKSIILAMENTLTFLLKVRKTIHNDTIKAWNYLITNEKVEM